MKKMTVKDPITGRVYTYEIEIKDGKKSIVFDGIVTYPELMRIKPKLKKKHKWLSGGVWDE